MPSSSIKRLTFGGAVVWVTLSAAAAAQNTPATSNDLTPESAVEARRALMRSIDAAMQQIEATAPTSLDDLGVYNLQQQYGAVGGMLLSFPHLFPAGSDIPEPPVAEGGNPSISRPEVWTNFPALVTFAEQAAQIAYMASMTPAEGLADQAAALRSACSSCHEMFMEYRSGVVGPVELPANLPFL